MELHTAVEKAGQILDEERAHPTVHYKANPAALKGNDVALTLAVIFEDRVLQAPPSRPRAIVENPNEWLFESENYVLLCALQSQIPAESRSGLASVALARINSPASTPKSELPLVAEFCARRGATPELLRSLCHLIPNKNNIPLLRHLEAVISLNWTLFTESEYTELSSYVLALGCAADVLRSQMCPKPELRPSYGSDAFNELIAYEETLALASRIREQCRKARYLHLKGSLHEGLNLEINQDKETVASYVGSLKFSPHLNESLNEAERLYRSGGDGFTMKSCMGHLRSFLENLQAEALRKLQPKLGGKLPGSWGTGLSYLREQAVISQPEEQFAAALFKLISDTAVHPLMAEREYARLARNMVIEYALLLLRTVDKKAG